MRRYEADVEVIKAELIDGVVYMPPPVSAEGHGEPQAGFLSWLGFYCLYTPGVRHGDNSTLRLDARNVPQPDAYLRILPEFGGRARMVDGYLTGGTELLAEISASSASYDLHEKLNTYQSHEIPEYVVWRTDDQEIDWFILRAGRYQPQILDASRIYKSERFPGLWLDVDAMLNQDLPQLMAVIQQGVATPEHAAFVARLQASKNRNP